MFHVKQRRRVFASILFLAPLFLLACSGSAGARGWAVHPHDVDRWEIKEMQCQAALVKGTCPATVASTTYTLTSVTVCDDGQTPADSSDELANVLNYSEAIGSGTAICVQTSTGGYRTLDGPWST